eukprot:c21716_g1_i1 orf=185-616(+)
MSASFRLICLLHAAVDIAAGSLMMFYLREGGPFGQRIDVTGKILGSKPHDHLLIRTSEALVGMCFVNIGLMLFMVSFAKDREFQNFFVKGCVIIHALMALWRLYFEQGVEDLAWAWPRQVVGDVLLGMSWMFFFVWSWREKYD